MRDAVRRTTGRRERGVALALVLAVLVCLLAVAIPFALSMRHEHGGVTFRASDDEARRTAGAVRDLALAQIGATAPDRDPTPWADGADETTPDLERTAQSLGADLFGDLGPRGRLLSAELDDQSGRIDLNRASLPLLARTLGLATTLASKLKADDKEVRLVDGSFLQDEGFLWIDGEITYYRRRDGSSVHDLTRPAIVPGVWEPARMPSVDPREFESGEEVLDFRAWMVAAWTFQGAPGREARFDSRTQPLAIARHGRGALGPEQRARLERLGTIWSADGGRDRFGLATRVFSEILAGETRELRVEQGAFVGRGTLCRLTTFDGKVDYGFVLRSSRQDDGFRITLEMPLRVGADAFQSVAEFLLPRPVNVNSCSREVLELLLRRLRLPGRPEVDERVGGVVADRIIAARPLAGMKALIDLLDDLVEKEKLLKDEQRRAILQNAEHSGSFLNETASAPFCFASDGVFDLRAAASLNFELNGRERARAFLREVVATAGAGPSQRAYSTQRDFEEPWRITRLARGWITLPENLQAWFGGGGAADPGSRLPAMMAPHGRAPSEELSESAARLAPGRMTIQLAQDDRTWHFDLARGDIPSDDPDGWRFADGPLRIPVDGGDGVDLVEQSSGGSRPRPLGVSMWWNPGRDLGAQQTLFDWKCNVRAVNPELIDRIRLRFADRKLEFEVDDAFLRESVGDPYTSKIVYDFSDGLPLEGDTWYHVTAFARGNRAGQMSLWIDGRPRGKWTHHTRLRSSFNSSGAGAGRISIDPARLAEGIAKFPTRGAVRVGTEVFEYTSAAAGSLTIQRDADDHFGGIRPAPLPAAPGSTAPPVALGGMNHPPESAVELYGYSARLSSDAPQGSANLDGEGLGMFGIAKVARSMVSSSIDLQPPGGGTSFSLGQGFEADATELDVVHLDGGKLQDRDRIFAKDGGYALLVSYYLGRVVQPVNPITGNAVPTPSTDSYQTVKRSWIQGVEVIGYSSFGDSKLKNLRRGRAVAQELQNTDLVEFSTAAVGGVAPPTTYHFVEPHAFVILPASNVWPTFQPAEFTVLVIPISVRGAGSNLDQHFLVPEVVAGGNDRCELLQIDSDFNGTKKDSTEWVRYDAIVRDPGRGWHFVRTDHERIAATQHRIEDGRRLTGNSGQITGNDTANLLNDIGLNPSSYAPGQGSWQALVDRVNLEDLTSPGSSNLAFRGVLATGISEHAGSVKIYPVFRTEMPSAGALPGRYDEVTFVGSGNERPERHIVNYAWSFPISEDWNSNAHVALLATELTTRFVTTPSPGFNTSTPVGYLSNATWYAESRNFARLLKFPSGELPSTWDGVGVLVVADGAGEGARIDELRVFAGGDPQRLFGHGLYVLARDVSTQEKSRVELIHDGLRFPARSIGGLAGLAGIHGDASVWQLGDDFVVGAERQDGIPIVQEIAQDGRTLLGIEAGHHSSGETAMVLPWFCMTRLSRGMSATDSRIGLVDAQQFPRAGFVMIDQEVLGHTDLSSGPDGAELYVPSFLERVTALSSQSRGDAAFRGRFGTPRQAHAQDAIVFFWPWRYADGFAERCDIPEMASLELPIAARRGFFHALMWKERDSDPLAALVATVRVQGRGGFAGDPDSDPDLFVFDRPGSEQEPNRIDRQGDLLRVRFHVRYRDGALDPVDFARNSWKRAPRLELVGVEYLADRVVESHEETR